ncbi:MAG TPA: dihydrolipoamide acetyltransferase family protein [Xanthobacteraceae bacterium]|jgi:pyruvate dehydrogenase E2 component (dihydrolipoamide acetyltransferase)|nr:dihydrolipoamide acetyltransferase family protein [Xanthobacteraceae bacterium]
MDILMPQLGETVAEGKITTWFKSIGDAVKPGDNLFEIETDKVSMEVPATTAGVLGEIRVGAGEVAPVGAVVAVLTGAPSATRASAAKTPEPAPAPSPVVSRTPIVSPPSPATSAPSARPFMLDPFREVRTPERNYGPAKLPSGAIVTPLARRLAGEAGIDLGRIAPSGPNGRVVARDVETAVAARAGRLARSPAAPSADRIKALYEPGSYQEIPLDSMRRTIAARLIEAKQTIPHFYLTADVAIERLNAVREEANATGPDDAGRPMLRLSINDFIIKALALALQRVPAANAVWAEDRVLRFHHSDVGVAVAVEGGLVTPVIRGAEKKSLLDISAEMKDLSARARLRKLKPAEIQGGVTAITNLGMHGVREFAAIINPPHATILAVGAAARRPVETADGGVRFVSQMTVTLSCDHRVIDGALGAELLAAFQHFIEHPVGLMI